NVRQALNLMSTWGVSQIPVIDGKDCVGSVSEGPLMARALEDGKILEKAVSEAMQPPFPVVDADVPLDRLSTLLSKETPAALVRRDGQLVGIVNRYDVLRQVAGIRGRQGGRHVPGGASLEPKGASRVGIDGRARARSSCDPRRRGDHTSR